MKLLNSNKKSISLDFGSSDIKIVEGQAAKGMLNITKNSILNISQGIYEDGKILDDIKLKNSIKESFKDSKINDNLSSTVIINSSSIITREVTIPKVSKNEIKSIIEFQLSEFLPINPDDYVVNHLLIGTTEAEDLEKLKIFLIAIPKVMVVNHLELIKESNLKAEILDFQGNAIAKLINFNTTINENYSINGKTIASVDIGNSSTNVTIIKEGNIEVTRAFDIGAKSIYTSISQLFDLSIDEAEAKIRSIEDINTSSEDFDDYHRILNLTRTSIDGLIESIQSIIRYYTSRTQNNKVDLIVLQGGFSNLNGICKMFTEYLSIETIKLESLDKVKFNGDLSLYANAIGGLIRRDEVKI